MPVNWRIEIDWEALQGAPAEEQACFGAIGLWINERWMTEGQDYLANRLRTKPYLSGYHLAEWLAWNWWRLRWEPRSSSREWAQSHCMATIGQGYVWPNISIFSDGERTALVSRPTSARPDAPLRYISDYAAVLPAGQFEAGLDAFFAQVIDRLDAQGTLGTNFHAIFESLSEERRTPALAARRKLEALLGEDPDEADPAIVERLLADGREAGIDAIQEIAAARAQTGDAPALAELRSLARDGGFEASPRNAVRLPMRDGLAPSEDRPAWLVGALAARALRKQERLDGQPISDRQLADMIGVSAVALEARQDQQGSLSFLINDGKDAGHLILRSKWHEGRRFELARLLGDRLLASPASQLFPATRASTYRQKMQRAFAAEFLSPFEEVTALLQGDYSSEGQRDAAEHFDVSPLTIRTLLVNHHRLPVEELGEDFDVNAA